MVKEQRRGSVQRALPTGTPDRTRLSVRPVPRSEPSQARSAVYDRDEVIG